MRNIMMCYLTPGSTSGYLVGRQETIENGTEQSRFAAAVAAPKIIGISILVVLSSLAASGTPQLTEFPGTETQLKSPDGRYVVENVDSDKEPHHTLLLKNTKTGAVRTLCNYQRHVTLLWSPDAKELAVNDYCGSDFSKALLFSADQDNSPKDIGAELLQSLKESPDRKSLAENHHVYFAVLGWEGTDIVRLKAWGHGDVDPKGFSRHYLYHLGGSFRRAH